MPELKPCPFCGGKAELKDYTANLYGFNDYEIKCECGCRVRSKSTRECYWEGNKYCTPQTEEAKNSALKGLLQLWETRTPTNPYWERITQMADKQRDKGIKTYGQGLELYDTPDAISRIEYIQEELIDGLMYLEWLKDRLRGELDDSDRADNRVIN